MSENVKFSVIVPTRERADTLVHCLRTIVAQDYENLTIIVSDNFSQDNTKEVVDSFSDSRIKYINTGKRISMSHNWEFALSHVTDGWVTIVGDDDGLLPGALCRVAEVIRQTGCQAITSRLCYYYWPRSTVADNQLTIPLASNMEMRNAREWLAKLIRGDAQYPELPCLYTGGFVDVQAINRARRADGRFFQSMIPDVYSAVALASVLESYVALNEPVAVAGVSSHSNGASTLGVGANSIPARKFYSEENIPFHSALNGGESVKSIPILVYESYLQAAHLHNDFLAVKLEHQLGSALAKIAPQHYADLRKFCSRVASDNMKDMTAIDQIAQQEKRRLFVRRLKEATHRILREMTLSGEQFRVRDVYGAACLAKATYVLKMHYGYWRLDNIYRMVQKFCKVYCTRFLTRRS